MSSDPYQVVIRPEASAEVADTARWYESQEPGLGREFLRAFRAATAVLRRDPLLYQQVMMDTRRVLLRRFHMASFTKCVIKKSSYLPASIPVAIHENGKNVLNSYSLR